MAASRKSSRARRGAAGRALRSLVNREGSLRARPAASGKGRVIAALATLLSLLGGTSAITAGGTLTPRFGLVGGGVSGPVCAFGGFVADEPQGIVECLDPTGSAWDRVRGMPTARGLLAAAEVGGFVYLIGGTRSGPDKLAVVERFDPATGEWRRVADLPTPRNALSAVTVGESIYVIGGWGVAENGSARDFDTVEIYDTEADLWRTGTALPTARSHMGAAAMGGRIYTFGGWIQRAGSFVALGEVEVYDARTDEWSSSTPMPTPRWLATALAIGGRIYVMGGWTLDEEGERQTTTVVEIFDPATGAWHRDAPLPTPRAGHAAALVDGRVLLFGGTSDETRESLPSHVDRYVPSPFDQTERIASRDVTRGSAATSRAEFRGGGAWGRIVEIERPFGNLRTSLVLGDLNQLGRSFGSTFTVRIEGREFSVTLGKDFSDVPRGEWVAFAMPDGTITLARNFASAEEACQCRAGAEVVVTEATTPPPESD